MEKAYFYLFTEISKLMDEMSALRSKMVTIQQNAEEMYISVGSDSPKNADTSCEPS